MPYKDPEKQKEYYREWCSTNREKRRKSQRKWAKENHEYFVNWRWQRIIRGICTRCGKPTVYPAHRCRECQEKHRQAERAREKRRKENGLCPRCGCPVEDGYITCMDCNAQIPKVRNEYENFRYPDFAEQF